MRCERTAGLCYAGGNVKKRATYVVQVLEPRLLLSSSAPGASNAILAAAVQATVAQIQPASQPDIPLSNSVWTPIGASPSSNVSAVPP